MTPPLRNSADYPQLAHTGSSPAANPAAVTLVTEDGFPIAGTRWLAEGDHRGAILIAPATGVPQRFYQPFAEYVASRGFDTLTWDWRGIGESRHESTPRDPRLRMRAWGEQDLAAAIAWADRRRSGGRIGFVGHSFGGQALGLAPNAKLVRRAVFIASQHGWIGHWPLRHRAKFHLLMRLAMPLAARLLGRFPSSRLGLGEDLPRGVALEWARWCRRREYLGTWAGHAALAIPLLSISFEDDPIAPRRAATALLDEYRRADRQHQHRPAEGLGHFGFFREGRAPALWDAVAAFLRGGE